ncbi:MAG TPA: methyltransferase domain-containing protein [Bacteroidetes bacterium]|nr:methyltransferase domain-containing protein [Bacteroidota bacterium]
MKIHHSHTCCLLLFILLFISACQFGPGGNGRSAQSADTDTSGQLSPLDSLNKADLKKLLERYEPPGRVHWQRPERVIEKIDGIENKVVADIGAGFGFFARRLAQHAKKVIAIELDEKLIHYMDSVKLIELKSEYQRRFETRLATPTDSKLKPGEADAVLIVNTYVLIKDRAAYLRHLWEVLPVGGQVVIVDFKKKRIPIRVPYHKKRIELYKVENELEKAGFLLTDSDDCSLEYQYIVVGEKQAAEEGS